MASDHPEKTDVALLIVTSERKFYLKLLALSLRWRKIRGVDHVLVVDTSINSRPSGGPSLLGSRHESYEIMTLPGVSFARVLRAAWASLSNEGASHVLMFEEDFVLLRRLPIERLVEP